MHEKFKHLYKFWIICKYKIDWNKNAIHEII